ALGSGMAPPWSLHLDPAAPIADKVAVLQRFLADRGFHSTGLMYAGFHYERETGLVRPHAHGDFAGQSLPVLNGKPMEEGYHDGEDTPYISGMFLSSQSLRFAVTREEEALEYAHRAFASIDADVRLAEAAGKPGYLCKPYGWQLSDQTSPD